MSQGQWNLIESDPGVFTELIENLNIKDVQVQELFSLDKHSLMSCLPLYGVIFLFKYTDMDRSRDLVDGIYQSELPQEEQGNIFFARQMINNACATQAVLNVLLNREDVDLGSNIGSFREFIVSFDPELKGETMTNSELIRTVHNSFSSPNMFEDETRRRDPEDDADLFHFIGFIQKEGRIWELDGLRPEPIAHDKCTPEEFVDKLPTVVEKRIARYPVGELHFSLMAVMEDRRKVYTAIGDDMALSQELNQRDQWKFDNSVRRMEMSGMVHEMMKIMAKGTTTEEWNEKMRIASEKGQNRVNTRSSAYLSK